MRPTTKMFIAVMISLAATLVGCSAPAHPTATATSRPTATSTPQPTATPTRSAPAVDATTLDGKVLFGYQGWFGCPQDGSPPNEWVHWFLFDDLPIADNLRVDFWPDTSELSDNELCPTTMDLPDSTPLMAYSSYNEATVVRHFQWMEQYGIDGVAVQRFVGGLEDIRFFQFRNQVAENVRLGAEIYGRVFYLEYDVSGATPIVLLSQIRADWEYMVDALQFTDSTQYLHQNGLPVVEIWGMGVEGSSQVSAAQAQAVIDYFHNADPPYQAFVIGGVGSYWRTGTRDGKAGEDWAAVYRSFDMINPWAVGRYSRNSEADVYRGEVIEPDLLETQNLGIGYMPVIFPGFSWANLMPNSPTNQIPRRCGEFYWRQAYNAIRSGARTIFVAMFDEVDEGTAMFKLVASQEQLPAGGYLVSLDVDGCALPSDWYLRLGGETGKMLRGEIPLSAQLPITP